MDDEKIKRDFAAELEKALKEEQRQYDERKDIYNRFFWNYNHELEKRVDDLVRDVNRYGGITSSELREKLVPIWAAVEDWVIDHKEQYPSCYPPYARAKILSFIGGSPIYFSHSFLLAECMESIVSTGSYPLAEESQTAQRFQRLRSCTIDAKANPIGVGVGDFIEEALLIGGTILLHRIVSGTKDPLGSVSMIGLALFILVELPLIILTVITTLSIITHVLHALAFPPEDMKKRLPEYLEEAKDSSDYYRRWKAYLKHWYPEDSDAQMACLNLSRAIGDMDKIIHDAESLLKQPA